MYWGPEFRFGNTIYGSFAIKIISPLIVSTNPQFRLKYLPAASYGSSATLNHSIQYSSFNKLQSTISSNFHNNSLLSSYFLRVQFVVVQYRLNKTVNGMRQVP